VLYLRGDQESTENYPAKAFQARAGGPCEVQIIPDCDHFYNGRENAVIEHVTGWLAGLSPTAG
jgi:alpha/beta superfamily hydrolase